MKKFEFIYNDEEGYTISIPQECSLDDVIETIINCFVMVLGEAEIQHGCHHNETLDYVRDIFNNDENIPKAIEKYLSERSPEGGVVQ